MVTEAPSAFLASIVNGGDLACDGFPALSPAKPRLGTYLNCLAFVAGFRLTIGTSKD
jgi:hypothetical protein